MSVINIHRIGKLSSMEKLHERQYQVDQLHEMLGDLKNLESFAMRLSQAMEERIWEGERITAGGSLLKPILFDEFIKKKYPVGIGATYEIVEGLIWNDPATVALWFDLTKRKPGNPHRDPITGQMVSAYPSLYNVHDRPAGTSRGAGLRKLQAAADRGNELAASELAKVVSGEKSVHRACIDAGLRKEAPKPDAEAARQAAEMILARMSGSELARLQLLIAAGDGLIAKALERLSNGA